MLHLLPPRAAHEPRHDLRAFACTARCDPRQISGRSGCRETNRPYNMRTLQSNAVTFTSVAIPAPIAYTRLRVRGSNQHDREAGFRSRARVSQQASAAKQTVHLDGYRARRATHKAARRNEALRPGRTARLRVTKSLTQVVMPGSLRSPHACRKTVRSVRLKGGGALSRTSLLPALRLGVCRINQSVVED
jgi:hypothetical protein